MNSLVFFLLWMLVWEQSLALTHGLQKENILSDFYPFESMGLFTNIITPKIIEFVSQRNASKSFKTNTLILTPKDINIQKSPVASKIDPTTSWGKDGVWIWKSRPKDIPGQISYIAPTWLN